MALLARLKTTTFAGIISLSKGMISNKTIKTPFWNTSRNFHQARKLFGSHPSLVTAPLPTYIINQSKKRNEIEERNPTEEIPKIYKHDPIKKLHQAISLSPDEVIQSLGRTDIHEAIRKLKDYVNQGKQLHEKTLNLIFKNRMREARNGHDLELFIREHMQMLNKLKTLPTRRTYNIIIDACGKYKEFTLMWTNFERMKAANLQPDLITYNSLIHAIGKQGSVYQVDQIYQEMKQNNIEPDVITYNTLMITFARSGLLSKSRNYIKI